MKLLKNIPLIEAQISELRLPRVTQLDDWVACLKIGSLKGGTFTVFYEYDKIRDIRRAVMIDHCEQAAYRPLPQPRLPKLVTDDDDVAPKQRARRSGRPSPRD